MQFWRGLVDRDDKIIRGTLYFAAADANDQLTTSPSAE
jgi:hypothetical protein